MKFYSRISTFLFGSFLAVVLLFPLPAFAAIINASAVLGQGGVYTTTTTNYPSGSVTSQGLSSVTSSALDTVNHRLFVSDSGNGRILVYPLDNNNHIATDIPNHVLGACDFVTAGATTITASTFGTPNSLNLAYDTVNSRLFVSNSLENRVLAFDVAPSRISNCEDATFVIGQTNFTSSGSAVTQSGLFTPDDIAYDSVNERLFVSNQNGNRVTAYSVPGNATSSINGENALFVLGQSTFTGSGSATSQSGLHTATGEAYDSVNERLFVGDYSNSRVMVFSVPGNATSSINGENALFVLGQPDFTSSSYVASQSSFAPDDLTYDTVGNRFFATDYGHSRVMIFNVPSNATSSINGENAQNNINQSNWTGITGSTAQNRFTNLQSSFQTFDPANGVFIFHETGGKRMLEVDMIHISTASLPNSTVGASYNQSIGITQQQGTSQTFSVHSGSLPIGLSLNSSTGAIAGISTQAGSYSFSVEADDNFTGTGYFFDRASYSITITAPPTLTTQTASSITTTSATLNGTITDTGYDSPTVRGFVYGADTAYGATTTESGSFSTGAFTSSLSSLTCNTTYHSAPYATNNAGTTYGSDTVFTTSACQSTGGGGGIVGSGPTAPSVEGLGGYIAPRPQIVYPDGTVVYLDATSTTTSTQTPTAPSTSSPAASLQLTSNYQMWDNGNDILLLQQFLNNNGFVLAQSGVGSPGNEINIFGPLTYRALVKFQLSNGVPGTGYLGPLTRAVLGKHSN